jgi:hypothetical protein
MRSGGQDASRNESTWCDPGVRTVLTAYSPQGKIETIGHNANRVIDKHLRRIDKRTRTVRYKYAAFVAIKSASKIAAEAANNAHGVEDVNEKKKTAKPSIPSRKEQAKQRVIDKHAKSAARRKRNVAKSPMITMETMFPFKGVGGGQIKPMVKVAPSVAGHKPGMVIDMPPPNTILTRRQKRRLRNSLRRSRNAMCDAHTRQKNAVKNLHYNIAHQLCRQYDTIGLPHYSIQQMVRGNRTRAKDTNAGTGKSKRIISRHVVRRMQALAYGKLTTRVKQTSVLYAGRDNVRASEAYTSCTCGKCGWKHPNLGELSVFQCQRCAFTMGRDENGARNFALRTMFSEHA